MLAPFRNRGYRWLWMSNLAASAGRWAMVLVLSTELLESTHSSFWVGCGLFLTQGPVILLAPVSGRLADRFDRRTLNVVCAASSSAVMLALAALTSHGRLPLFPALALSVLYGVSFVFQMTLRSTLVPSLLPAQDLLRGISLFQVATQGAQFLGPLLATPILVARGGAAAWLFCAALYAVAAVLSIPVGSVRARRTRGDSGATLVTSLRYLVARPLVWAAIMAVSLHCAFTMGYQGMLPMFVNMDLRASSSTYGALLAAIGLGAMSGSLLLAARSADRHWTPLFAGSLVGSGAFLALMATAPSPPVAVAFGFLVGATQAMFMSMALAVIQGSVEDEFRGRATSFYQLITMTPMAIFGWGMGGLADVAEPRPVMIASAVIFLVVIGVYASASRALRALFRPLAWSYEPAPATVA